MFCIANNFYRYGDIFYKLGLVSEQRYDKELATTKKQWKNQKLKFIEKYEKQQKKKLRKKKKI
mgnify:CR=1 FL=1